MSELRSITFTIITVVYNDANGLEKTINSVLSQTYSHLEYIVIDGGSTDGTRDVIKKYERRLTYSVSEPDDGIYDAMNKGLKLAKGDYVNFMNAKDVFCDNNVLQNIADILRGKPDIIFGDLAVENDGVLYVAKAKPFYESLPLHHDAGFNHQCTFVKTSLAQSHPFDLSYKLAADYNMIISLYREKASFQQVDFVIALYDLSGVSQKNKKQHLRETLHIDNPNRPFYNAVFYYFFRIRHHGYSAIKGICSIFFPTIYKRMQTKGAKRYDSVLRNEK